MNIEISSTSVDRIVDHFIQAGIASGDKAQDVERLIDALSQPPHNWTIAQIVQHLQKEQSGGVRKTPYEVAQQFGLIGAMDGPTDLATNPEHMNGFGE